MGAMLGPASTDAVNRASRLSYGEATGITQTVRNYAAALGIAILGNVLVTEMHSRLTDSLVGLGMPREAADAKASDLSQQHSANIDKIPRFFRLDFAYATRSVLMAMAGIMAVAAVVAIVGLKRGVQEEENLTPEDVDAQATAGTEPA